MAELVWEEEGAVAGGVRERGFFVERAGERIPGVIWQPAAQPDRAQPLILIGHEGFAHKRDERPVRLGRLFAGECGWHAACIDAPSHGARGGALTAGGARMPDEAYKQMWQGAGVVEGMTADWHATLDALAMLPGVDASRVGYWGVSMGTMFGLPFVASEARVRAALLGKAGMAGPSVLRSGIDRHFAEHAPRLAVPLMFVTPWDDENFDRDGQLDLFGRIGSVDKRLHAYPGLHRDNSPELYEAGAAFFRRYLASAAV